MILLKYKAKKDVTCFCGKPGELCCYHSTRSVGKIIPTNDVYNTNIFVIFMNGCCLFDICF